MENLRKIIHIDMDAFYASVEQRDFPELKGKPVAVGGSKERGVVAAASYEARKFGVHSALASKIAYQRCPEIIFVPPRFDVYKAVSKQAMEIFEEYTDLVEPLSLDEAYLDVTFNKHALPSATLIAKEIRARIKKETGLTASAGVSFNKFLAKIASDINKPDGLTVVPPAKAEALINALPIEKFYGIGKVTAAKMKSLGIFTGADLKQRAEAELTKYFGKTGSFYYHIVRGEDDREVEPDRIHKSVGAEDTFEHDLTDENEMLKELGDIAQRVEKRLARNELKGRTITLKIKYHDFTLKTRGKTIGSFVQRAEELMPIVEELLRTPELPVKPVRLLGISVSNLNTPDNQKSLQLTFDF